MARARDVQGIDCGEPFSNAAGHVVAVRAAEVFEQQEGVLDLSDPDRVHDMRVATRRLRAALEFFEPCLPAKRRRKTAKRVKKLADALGQRRDCDVAIELLQSIEPEVAESDRPALESLLRRLRKEQRQANDDLAAYVTHKRLRKLRKRLDELVQRELV